MSPSFGVTSIGIDYVSTRRQHDRRGPASKSAAGLTRRSGKRGSSRRRSFSRRASRAPATRSITTGSVTDALTRIAAEGLGGASLEEALRVVLFEHKSRTALARLAADPAAAGSYLAQSSALAETDTSVRE